ncbi:MAG TPA: PIN domain-containing protein [Anaerolineae bacterium]|nr:PIN domain-containing protein [Anaerolineae bacterium]
MTQKLLLVDFENVQQVDLARLDETYEIIIFVGATQKSIPIELVVNAQKLGSRIEWQRVDASGSNALDFFITCQLGRVLETSPQLHCLVLSKDKGFDPLLRHLNKIGLKCKRLNSLLELDPNATQADEANPNYKRVVELLGKSEKKSRPRKLKTLSQHISSMFQKKINQTEIDRIIDILFANKLISETNGIITYEF